MPMTRSPCHKRADGALASTADNLNTIRSLAVQSANFTNSASDRAALQAEALALTNEIQRIATTTQFNGLNILDGTLTSAQFQIGANAGQTVSFAINSAQTQDIGNQGFQGQNSSASSAQPATAVAATSAPKNSVGSQFLQSDGKRCSFDLCHYSRPVGTGVASTINLLSGVTGNQCTCTNSCRLHHQHHWYGWLHHWFWR